MSRTASRGPVLAGLLVVLLVEPADQLLEHGAHRVVVELSWGQIDLGIEELVDQGAECVSFREGGELVPKFEVVDDVLNVGREAVQILLDVAEHLLLSPPGLPIAY